jgi:hypothetical protein
VKKITQSEKSVVARDRRARGELANEPATGVRESGDPVARRSTATQPIKPRRLIVRPRGAAKTLTPVEIVARKLKKLSEEMAGPRIDSFADFLVNHARVKSGAGYVPYHFKGREALRPIVDRLDQILASGETDCSLAICGGAQFGKTVLMLNLLAYLVAVRFRNVGYYLPDDDLVQGLVDGKLRPDVLDQIPWLARLIAVGKTLTATGRAANRKGAFLCTDGARTALAFMRGLGKIPTSFSMDVVMQDEKDDLPDEHARFLAGRMAEAIIGDARGTMPNGTRVQTVDAGARGQNPFADHLRYQDEQIVLAATGGKLTALAESGTGTLAGSAHQQAFDDIAEAEAVVLSEIFQKQFDAPLLAREFPGQPPLAYFELALTREVDAATVVEQALVLAKAGYEIDPAQLSEKTGYTLKLRDYPLPQTVAPPAPNFPSDEAEPIENEI